MDLITEKVGVSCLTSLGDGHDAQAMSHLSRGLLLKANSPVVVCTYAAQLGDVALLVITQPSDYDSLGVSSR